MKNNVQKVIRSFLVRDFAQDSNVIEYDVGSNQNKIAVFDSELLRIVEAADADNIVKKTRKRQTGLEREDVQIFLPGLISLKIGWSTSAYRKRMETYGGKLILKHVKRVNINRGQKDTQDKEMPREYEYQQVLDKEGNQVQEVFVRLIVGSSQGRAKKAIYIREDLYDDVNKVLLGGMDAPELAQKSGFPAFSGGYAKWNAYYGLASTDSVAMDYVPRIVVVKDFEREVTDRFDVLKPVVRTYPGEEEGGAPFASTEYDVKNNVERTISIKPFDGAGLVSVECAKKWAEQLGLDLGTQLPAAFQIRMIPGIKGNLYTFDIAKFGRVSGRKIKDNLYDPEDPDRARHEHDPAQVDVILTESQVKFLKMYGYDLENWRKQFDEPVLLKNGRSYRRTFNISEHAPGQDEVKEQVRTAYQHWQTIHNTEKECEHASLRTLKQLERISTDVDAFLKYRCYVDEGADPEDLEGERILPFYKAAYKMTSDHRRLLFADPYFQKKAAADLDGAYRRAMMGKLSIRGNYQYLTPDLFALAQHSFGMEKAEGLLPAGFIYSSWWFRKNEEAQNQAYAQAYGSDNRDLDIELLNRYYCSKLALIRNPHIYMEARVARMADGENVGWLRYDAMEEWYQYQTTGILTDSYSTIPLALGTADFDGDTIITTNCHEYLIGVERAMQSGKGNTLFLEQDKGAVPPAEDVTDRAGLLEADIRAYENDIGSVVNRVTSLWGLPYKLLDMKVSGGESTVRDYIKTMAIIGQLTIDAAKTGEVPQIPENIRRFFGAVQLKKPWFLLYQDKRKRFPRDESELGVLPSNANNMDQISNLVEKKIVEIRNKLRKPDYQFSTEQFFQFFLCGGKPALDTPFYIEMREKLVELAEKNNKLFQFLASMHKEDQAPHYRYLYDYAREEFLQIAERHGVTGEALLDGLIFLSYTDKKLLVGDGAKNILWNAFEDEMVERAARNTLSEEEFPGLDEEIAEILQQIREEKQAKRKAAEADKTAKALKFGLTTEPIHIRVLEDKRKKYNRIQISQSDLDLICEKVSQAPSERTNAAENKGEQPSLRKGEEGKLRRLYAVLMVIYKYWGKVVVKKSGNNDLTRTKLAYLCYMGSQRKRIYDMLKKLHGLGAIQMDDSVDKNIRIKVLCGVPGESELLIDTDDYAKACQEILFLLPKTSEPKK